MRFRFPLLLLVLLLPCIGHGQVANERVLVLGRVSDNPSAHYSRLKPMLDYVVAELADVGVTGGRILMARDAQQMLSYVRQGKVDWITETAGAAIMLNERSGASPFLVARRGGLSEYHSVIFVRRDSGIRSLSDLRGRTIAFQHPMSTSSYLVPAAELLGEGLLLAIQASPLERPQPEFVGYVFGRSESNLLNWVQKRLVDGAAFSNQDWEGFLQEYPDYEQELRIIHESESFPRGIELVRADLEPRVRDRLHAILSEAHLDPAAAEPMRIYFGTDRFEAIDEHSLRSLERLRVSLRRVREQIE